MRLFGRSPVRRLRAGPTLLLGDTSENEVLEAVRRFDPSAELRDGKIRLQWIDLVGPIELTTELAAKAKLPGGWASAYVAVSTAPRRLPPVVSVVRGLEHALNGQSHKAGAAVPDDMWIDPVVSVFFEDRVPEERLRAVVAPFIDGLTIERDSDGDYYLEGDGPINIACCGTVSYDPDSRPPRLDGLTAMECAVFVDQEALPIASDLLHRAGRIALAIAGTAGGVALDIHGFEVRRPEDVHLKA